MNIIIKIITVITVVLFLFSCKSKLDQSTMFHGRTHKNKKGVYNTGLNSKKTVSMQIAKEYDKMSKHDTNPKKAARKANKELEKKKRASQKARAKYNKKRHVKVKTTEGKSGGDK